LALAGGLVVSRAADGARGERPWLDLTAAAAPQPGADVQQLRASLDDALVFAVAARGVDPAPGQRARSASARRRLTTAVERDKQYFVIRAKLSETGSGAVVWSKRFERAAGRTSGFAETTAAHVSDVAACAQRNAQRHRRELSTSLLALLLSACSAAQYEDVPAMLETTERLVRAAPNLADAHALHAAALMGATNVVDGDARGGALAIARAEAREALRLDPDNPEAHAVLGAGRGQSWMARDRHITRAMAVEPHDSRVDTVDIFFLQATGRSREAASVAARSAAEDPFNGGALERLAWLQAVQGRVPDAWATVRRLELVDPPLAEDLRLRIAFWHGPPAEAVPMLRSPSDGADAEVAKCMRDYLAARAAAGLPQSCRGVQSDIPVRLLGRSGQLDAAYAVADIPPRELNAGTLYLFYPEMAAFRRDPRFMPLADRLGLVDYWLQSGHWPDFCAEPGLPYDCRAVARRLHGG
jgi:Flp pilus assembly protein TadD